FHRDSLFVDKFFVYLVFKSVPAGPTHRRRGYRRRIWLCRIQIGHRLRFSKQLFQKTDRAHSVAFHGSSVRGFYTRIITKTMRYVKGGSRKSDISLYIALYYLWAIRYNKITISDVCLRRRKMCLMKKILHTILPF